MTLAPAFDVTDDDDFDLNDLLMPVAAAALGDDEELGEGSIFRALMRPVELQLEQLRAKLNEAAVHFDEARHPRWPKGTARGGQFVRSGQSFHLDGHEYQVAHVVSGKGGVLGKIYAHLAGGKKADTIEVHAVQEDGHAVLKSISDPKVKKAKGGKGQDSTVTAISPYVEPSTHDPSIPIPETSSITPEQWKLFGKVDQEHYTEVQDRFGKWSPGSAKAHVDKAYADYGSQITNLVQKQSGIAQFMEHKGELVKTSRHGNQVTLTNVATGQVTHTSDSDPDLKHTSASQAASSVSTGYQQQYGSSSGLSLSLIAAVNSIKGLFSHGGEANEDAFQLREDAMVLQGEHRAAVHWDLYNRTKSPDMTAFHKSTDNTSFWDNMINGDKRAFSGLSQTFFYGSDQFGKTCLGTPLAIRHVLLASQSAQPVVGESHFVGEREISVPEQMVLDKRSISWTKDIAAPNGNKLSPAGVAWLNSVTQLPTSGRILALVRNHFRNGDSLPNVPEQANIQLGGDGENKTWVDPEITAWKGIQEKGYALSKPGEEMLDGEWFLKDGTAYAVSAQPDGSVIGKPLSGSAITIGAHDSYPVAQPAITAGLKAGDYIQGLQGSRYIVVADPGDTGYGLRRIEGTNSGQTPGKAFLFSGGGSRPFFRLDGHYEPTPSKAAGDAPFDASLWTQGEHAVPVKQMEPGAKFKVDGLNYEFLGAAGTTANIKSLDSGKVGTMNANYPTNPLVLKKGSGVADVSAPDVAAAPKVGDWVAMSGEKYVVQGIMTNGKVKLKRPGKPGINVVAHDDPIFANLHRPSDYEIGGKAKLRDLAPGEKFHMGVGSKQKPYLVISHGGPGKPTVVRDLSTGKEHAVSRNTSYAKLVPSLGPESTPTPTLKPSLSSESVPAAPVASSEPHDPTAYTLGEKMTVGQMRDGTKFRTPSGVDYQIVSHEDDTVTIASLDGKNTDFVLAGVKTSALHTTLVPKAEAEVSHANMAHGDTTKISALEPGDQFTDVGGPSTGHTMQLVAKATADEPAQVAVVYGGKLGTPFAWYYGDDPITFKRHAAGAGASPYTGVAPEQVDPTSLPTPEGFQGYSSGAASGAKASGGYSGKHDRIGDMAVGTVFRDKSGKLWKVKLPGASPIITDGTKNYTVDGMLRGRAHLTLGELPQGDTSPPVGSVEDSQAHAAASVMKPNTSIEMEQLSPNDLIELPSGIYRVEGHGVPGVIVKSIEDGHTKILHPGFVPAKVALSHPLEDEPAAKAPASVPVPIAGVPDPDGQPVHTLNLKPGDTIEDGNGVVHQVTKSDIFGIETIDGNGVHSDFPVDALVSKTTTKLSVSPPKSEPANIVGQLVASPAALQPGDMVGGGKGATGGHYVVKSADEAGVQLLHPITGGTMNVSSDSVKNLFFEGHGGGPAAPLPIAPTTSDLAAWTEGTHEEGPWTIVGNLNVGDVFKGQKGGFHQVIGQTSGIASIKSLKTGAVYQLPHGEWRKLQVPKSGAAAEKAEKAAETGGAASPTGIPSYDAVKLDVTGGTGAGGSTGAKIVNAADGTKFLLKTYGGNADRVATELLANSVYREMGAKVADAGTYTMPDGSKALAYPLLEGKAHKITEPSAEIGKHFMTDALIANWDFIGLSDDNVLWDKDGKPFRVDQGGTFQYRAQGQKKSYGPIPSEVWSMLDAKGGQGHGKVAVSFEEKRAQAAAIAKQLTPKRIDELVKAAPFADEQMRSEVAKSLNDRVSWMLGYAVGDITEPGQPPVTPLSPPDPPMTSHAYVDPGSTDKPNAYQLGHLKNLAGVDSADVPTPTAKAMAKQGWVTVGDTGYTPVTTKITPAGKAALHASNMGTLDFPKPPAASPVEAAIQKLEAKYGTLAGVPAAPDFSPFKSPSGTGGAYKHPKLSTLTHGQEFVDKLGVYSTFITKLGNEAIIVSTKTGAAGRVPLDARVKLKGTGGA